MAPALHHAAAPDVLVPVYHPVTAHAQVAAKMGVLLTVAVTAALHVEAVAAVGIIVQAITLNTRRDNMFKVLQTVDNTDKLLTAITNLNLSVAENGSLDAADEMNTQLLTLTKNKPAFECELLLLDCFQSAFLVFMKTHKKEEKEKLEEITAHLFTGLSFYTFNLLWNTYEEFTNLADNFTDLNAVDHLSSLAEQAGSSGILAYLIKREMLNLLMRATNFVERLDLTKSLVADLDKFDISKKETLATLGGEIYFYGVRNSERKIL